MDSPPVPIDDSLPMKPDEEERDYYHQPPQQQPQYYYMQPQPSEVIQQPPEKKASIFSELDKTTWIFVLAVFIIGFFMGKSMTPVIIKSI
jgi:hypothetical protein